MTALQRTKPALGLLRWAGFGLVLVCACRPPIAAPAQPCVETPAPVAPTEPAAAPLAPGECASGDSRWLASRPRVPFAIVEDGSIASADAACCKPWSSSETRWQGIDAWGQALGTARVSEADYYDATQCWELTLKPEDKNARPALYVSGDWAPSPSFEWQPSRQERADFSAFLAALQAMTVSPEYHRGGYTKRRDPPPTFFKLPPTDDSHNVHPTNFAVVGGSTFAVAYIAGDRQWKLGTLLNDTAIPVGPVDTYDVVAIVDMDADGFPEVVVHSDEGPAWNDVVLKLDNPYQRYAWSPIASSILGGTM